MMRLIVDTSILIDHLRDGMTWRKVVAVTDRETEFFIPTVVIYELYSGKSTRDPEVLVKVQKLVKQFELLELTDDIAKRAGELYRDMKVKIEAQDYIIAASAIEIGGQVVTLNQKDFKKIPAVSVYPV